MFINTRKGYIFLILGVLEKFIHSTGDEIENFNVRSPFITLQLRVQENVKYFSQYFHYIIYIVIKMSN